ncbi:MAG: FG-GAP-like repeat-containing protein [Planctomycetota bacterium]
MCLFALQAIPTPAGAQVDFVSSGAFAAAVSPESVVVSDFDNDGHVDLAGAGGSAEVVILLGDGTGSLSPTLSYPVAPLPRSIAAADFNEDGNVDLAVASAGTFSGDGTVAVLLGDGTGGLGPPQDVETNVNPAFVVAADFNEDGHPDLATAKSEVSSGQGTVSVSLGDGLGGFSPPQELELDLPSELLVTADFNEDSHLDLAVAHPGFAPGGTGVISILFGDGAGSFTMPQDAVQNMAPVYFATADFNEDGHLDLAVRETNFLPDWPCTAISILVGDGAGGFSPAVALAVGCTGYPFAVADFDMDGDIDLAVPERIGVPPFFGNRSLFLLPGDGTAAFGEPLELCVDGTPETPVVADLNENGYADLVVLGFNSGVPGNVMSVFINQGALILPHFVRGDVNADGAFNIADPIEILGVLFAGAGAAGCQDAADANDDGRLDIADPISMLNSLFLFDPWPGQWSPPACPDIHCGADPTGDALDCASSPQCP